MLYLNVDGLSNLAIAEGTVCRFTRVVGSGLEGMATELAERRGIALGDARARLLEADLTVPRSRAARRGRARSTPEPELEVEPCPTRPAGADLGRGARRLSHEEPRPVSSR